MTKSTPKKRPVSRKTSKVTAKRPIKKTTLLIKGGFLAVVGLLFVLVMPLYAHSGQSTTVYNAIPASLPGDVANVGFGATRTSELGDFIHLGGTSRTLGIVSVVMSTQSVYETYRFDSRYTGNASTWTHPITMTIYGNGLSEIYQPQPVIATMTQDVSIPWRPIADPTCPDPTQWKATNGTCYSGKAFTVTFDMSSLAATLPNNIVVSVAFNSAQHGYNPLGLAGPYDNLGVATPASQVPTVGIDDNTDALFWNTLSESTYSTGGAPGLFNQNTSRAPYGTIAYKITTPGPLPGTKDDCKNDGWKNYGTSFKNQGQCVSYREHDDDNDRRDSRNRDSKKDNKRDD
jgi:hypothetical protein